MALIKCHECGQQVSTEAEACPNCGAKPKAKAVDGILNKIVVGAILLSGAAWFFYHDAPTKPADSSYSTPEPQAKQLAANLAAPAVESPKRIPNHTPDGKIQMGFHDGPPIGTPTKTKKMGVIPGAVICQTLRDTDAFYNVYVSAWQQREMARRKPEEYAARFGTPPELPVAASMGCVIASPGTEAYITKIEQLYVLTVPTPGREMYFTGVSFWSSYEPVNQ